jgi:hypothetical protein
MVSAPPFRLVLQTDLVFRRLSSDFFFVCGFCRRCRIRGPWITRASNSSSSAMVELVSSQLSCAISFSSKSAVGSDLLGVYSS